MSFFVVLILLYLCDAEVLHLDDTNFDHMTSNGLWYIEFHAPWCEYCKVFAPIYEAASYDPELQAIRFGAIDGSAENGRELAKKFDVTRFPFITFYENGEKYRFSGSDTLQGLKEEGLKMLQPVIKDLSIPTFNEFHDRYTVSFLHIINDKNSNIHTGDSRDIYYMVAMKFRPSIPFYSITYSKFKTFLNDTNFIKNTLGFDKKAIENKFTEHTGSTLFAIKQSTKNEEVSEILLSKDEIQEFIEENRYSPIIQLKLGNYKDLVDSTMYFGIIFVDGDGSNDEFDEKSIELIDNAETLMIKHKEWNKESFKQYKHWKFLNMNVMDDVDESDKVSMDKRQYKMIIAFCNFIEYESWASHQFGINTEELPVMLIYSPKQDGYWKYDMTFSNMLEFVNAVFEDKFEITYSRHWIVRSVVKLGKWYYSLSQWQVGLMFGLFIGALFGMKALWDYCCYQRRQRVKND